MDKLTIEDAEHWANSQDAPDDETVIRAMKQLADTMRENEAMKKELATYRSDEIKLMEMASRSGGSIGLQAAQHLEELQHKDSAINLDSAASVHSSMGFKHPTKT